MFEITTDGAPHALLVIRGLVEAGVEHVVAKGRIFTGDPGALEKLPEHWRKGASLRDLGAEPRRVRRTISGVQRRAG